MTPSGIELEYRGHCAVITLNRPEKRNAFNREMWPRSRSRLHDGCCCGNRRRGAVLRRVRREPESPVPELMGAVQKDTRQPRSLHVTFGRRGSPASLPVPLIARSTVCYGGGAVASRATASWTAQWCFRKWLGPMPDWRRWLSPDRGARGGPDLTARRVGPRTSNWPDGPGERAPGRALESRLPPRNPPKERPPRCSVALGSSGGRPISFGMRWSSRHDRG